MCATDRKYVDGRTIMYGMCLEVTIMDKEVMKAKLLMYMCRYASATVKAKGIITWCTYMLNLCAGSWGTEYKA